MSFRDATEARHAYRRGQLPGPGQLDGDWFVTFLGNDRYLDVLKQARRVLGLGKMIGVRFHASTAWRLVGREPKKAAWPKKVEAVKPMAIGEGLSAFDGAPTVLMTNDADNGPLYRYFSSEVRQHDPDTLLVVDLVGWRDHVIPMPIVLTRPAET